MFQPAFDAALQNTARDSRDNRRALRVSTQQMHELSEVHWERVFKTPEGTTRFLAAMENLHRSFGVSAAVACGLAGAAALEQARLTALHLDLGLAGRVPLAAPAQAAMGRDAAWGVLYALNGSALGATALLRPGAALADQPSRYLTLMQGYAQSGGLGRFFRALNDQALDVRAAAAGVDAVFAAMSGHELGAEE